MLYISCKKGDLYGVTDTDDGVVEMYTVDKLLHFIRSGLDIKGISTDKGKVIIYCKSDNILNDFIKSIKSTLAMLSLFGVSEREAKIRKIQDLAVSYGIVLVPTQLSIDVDRHKLFIKSSAFNTFVDYETGCTIKKLDVCDKNVADLSRLGTKAFENITLTVGKDLVVTISDVLKELNRINKYKRDWYTQSIDMGTIDYIGITPSNKMFKIVTGSCIYSVKVDTIDKVKKDLDKILNTKVEKADGYDNYLYSRINCEDVKFVVSKCSIKPISFELLSQAVCKLRNKYPTLHDVYVRY